MENTKPTKFTLNISLKNEAMSTEADVAQALRSIAHRVETFGYDGSRPIVDNNGNTVGSYYAE